MQNLIVEGLDNLGKSLLIDNFIDQCDFLQKLHFQKPRSLQIYNGCLQKYQLASFNNLFNLLNAGGVAADRGYLGEYVYSPLYRQYNGEYVFDLEKQYVDQCGSAFNKTTLLVLLVCSDFSIINDDGLSFNTDNRTVEQAAFTRAFKKSIISNKIIIDVCNGRGGFVDKKQILQLVKQHWNHEMNEPQHYIFSEESNEYIGFTP